MKRLIIFILTLVSAASAAAPVISSIAVNNVTSTCITWTWTTDVPADSLVGYSPTGNYYDRDAGVKDAWGVTSHSYQVCGLYPNSPVMYLIRSRNVATGEAAFVGSDSLTPASATTAPAPTDGTIDWYFDLYGQHQITQGYDGYLAWRSGLLAGTLVNWTWKVIVSGLPPYTEIHWPDAEDLGQPVRYTTTTIPRDTYYDEWGMARAARVRLVTNVGGVTPPGSYTLSFHTEANGGVVTKTSTWPLTVVAP